MVWGKGLSPNCFAIENYFDIEDRVIILINLDLTLLFFLFIKFILLFINLLDINFFVE